MSTFWFIVLCVIWGLLVVVSCVVTLFMFAFADSPGAGKAAKRTIGPIFVAAIVLFGISAQLLWRATWWSVPVAYGLVLLPPVLVFAGYNVLMKSSSR